MRWRGLGRGFFERPPRVLYRRARARYLDVAVAAAAANGVVVAGFGLVTLVLYVDLSARELAAFGACSAAGYVAEGVVAGVRMRRLVRPAQRWLAGEGDGATAVQAWAAVAELPLALVRLRSLYVVGAAGAAAADLVLAGLLELPAREAALLFPASFLLYLSSVVLRFMGMELTMRPLLEDLGDHLPAAAPPEVARVSLHRRLLAAVPMVTWGTALITAGLLTDDARDLDTIGPAAVVAVGVTAAVSLWLSLVLADAVSGPVIDLRDATRRVAQGDLGVRVPVVSTDETGELAASFNAMVAGLGERDRLHEAFGAFVDPAVTQRVLAEGTDLRGEELDASVVFLDVRGFTEFAEGAAARDVVASLNALYEAVVPVIRRHGGHANKFVGDGLLAVFGAPERLPDHAARAVAAAREIAQLVRRGDAGRLRVGLGVNSGRVVVGTIGGGGRRDFTVVGDVVNTAARVEAATRETGDDLLITGATRRLLHEPAAAWVERPAMALKGKREPVALFAPAAP
ncbi:MAG TPA: adenylate/guanylate cyclase domain-containing protein [Baekduia sp.]|nr:adenylate/guanylate cyclase domain-containing protein [Baekduia sp.]